MQKHTVVFLFSIAILAAACVPTDKDVSSRSARKNMVATEPSSTSLEVRIAVGHPGTATVGKTTVSVGADVLPADAVLTIKRRAISSLDEAAQVILGGGDETVEVQVTDAGTGKLFSREDLSGSIEFSQEIDTPANSADIAVQYLTPAAPAADAAFSDFLIPALDLEITSPAAQVTLVRARITETSFIATVTTTVPELSLSPIDDVTIDENSSSGAIPVTVQRGSPGGSCLDDLSLDSSDPGLVANASAVFSGSWPSCTLTLTPEADATGTATLTVTASDGARSAEEAFLLTVSPVAPGFPQNLTCPQNYVKIPKNTAVGVTSDFCVMKYEAKNVSGVATSQAALAPWVSISRGTDATTAGGAWKSCKDLGSGYDLISNAQWQAIARNIEGVHSNWSWGNSVGAITALNRGHSDNSPGSPLAASTDGDPCSGTSNPNCTSNINPDFTQKRTHALSNGEVIWDIAGNVWEWVQDNNSVSQGANDYDSQLTSANYDLSKWGPAGNFVSKNSGEYGGLGYGYLNASAGAVLRGGFWDGSTLSGVFAANLAYDPANSHISIGFRCVYVGGS